MQEMNLMTNACIATSDGMPPSDGWLDIYVRGVFSSWAQRIT